MDAADLLETHIKPYLLKTLGDADAIMLSGSHARALRGETAAIAKKNSDYDFIIYFDTLPARYPAAMFASQWLTIPGHDEPVSIDLKIIDRAYLEYHTRHTHEVRRFPFLFSMIMDAFPLTGDSGLLATLRQMAIDFITAGPAPIGPRQIAETQGKLDSLEAAMGTNATPRDHAITALEGLPMLANAHLTALQKWVSPIGRALVTLRDEYPGTEKRLVSAFNQANGGDYVAYRTITRDITQLLHKRHLEGNADSALLNPNAAGAVTQNEIDVSNNKGDKIMLGQYLARLKDAADMDPLRLTELKCVLWTTAKSYLCRRFHLPFAYGAKQAYQLDTLMGQPVLEKLLSGIQHEDITAMHTAINLILGDQSGIAFGYLERIYTEDLARRRESSGHTSNSSIHGHAITITPFISPPAAP